MKLRGKKFLPSPASRTKEQKQNLDVIMPATSSELSDINELRVLKLSFELCLSSPLGF